MASCRRQIYGETFNSGLIAGKDDTAKKDGSKKKGFHS
jgi:hypothetical protein